MVKITSTYGTTESFVSSALMGLGASAQDANGRFYVDGSMVNVELSQVIAEAIYIEEVFRNGQSVTDKYTTERNAGAIRVLLDAALPSTSRTASYGGRKGTPGNGGVINTNPPLLPSNDEFMIYLNQLNDQAMLFPDLGKEYIPLDIMAKKIAAYAKSVAQDRSASTLAEIIAYNAWRALNDGDNLVNAGDLNVENAYADLLNDLNAKMDNGDLVTNAFTYPTEGRTILGRPKFINRLFSRKSGVIMLGGDLAQTMLKDYDLDARMSDRRYVGTGYKGYAMQFHFQSVPDYIWSLAELYLGLKKGALDNVLCVAVSYQATAMGKVVDLGVKLIDANEVRGVKAQPLNIWGHEAIRKSYLVGDATLTTTYLDSALGLKANERKYPVAPKEANPENSGNVTVPVYGEDGVTVIGYRTIAKTVKPNGGNVASGLPHVANITSDVKDGFEFSETQDVKLSTVTEGAEIYYTEDGSLPTLKSSKYSDKIALSETKTIKAIAVKSGFVPSDVFTATYKKKGE